MQILITTPVYPPDLGGPATFVPPFAEHLVAQGHQLTVLTFGSARPSPSSRWTVVSVPRVTLPLRYLLFFIRCLFEAARADVVFSCEHPRLFSVVAARLSRRPLVVRVMVDTAWEMAYRLGYTKTDPETFRHQAHPWKVRWLQHLERWELSHADRAIAVSEHLATMAVAMGSTPERTVVCKNLPHFPGEPGLDQSTAARVRLNMTDTSFQLLVVARLVPWKGIDEILDAVEGLAGEWHLTIAGDGPCRAALETRVAGSVRLAKAVDFLGAIDHETTMSFMQASDVLILNSRYEGLSHVLLEAMALGLPIVAGDNPGNSELIRQDIGGILVPPDDVAALRTAIDRLQGDPEERTRLATGARADLERLIDANPLSRLENEVLSVVRKRGW